MTSPDDRARRVEIILERIERLPTLSPVAARLMRVAGQDDADLDEIIGLIESDPSLSATVLGLCRRAELGLGDRITTVRRAIVMLGLETVQSIVLSVSVYGVLGQPDRPGENEGAFDHAGLWTHCVSVGVGAELIARAHRALGVAPEQAFVAGLLANLGRLALEFALPGGYEQVVRAAEARRCDIAPVERELLGLDHFVAGRRLAQRWDLPEPLRDVIWLHGQPLASVPEVEHRTLVGLVTLATAWARAAHLGWTGDFGPGPDVAAACQDLGLPAEALDAFGESLAAGVAGRCEGLGIGTKTAPALLLESIARANQQLSTLNARLSRRARQADGQRAALGAVAAFCATVDPARGVGEVLGAVARSAAGVLGGGFCAAVHQAHAGDAWEVLQFGPDGEVRRRQTAEAPPGGMGVLAGLGGSPGVSMAAMGVLPWLSDYLADAADLRRVRVLGLCGDEGGAAAALLHEADPAGAGLDAQSLGALVAAWGGAVRAAALHERSRRLGEQLADANRRVGEMQRALTERESMARLGEMTAGAAHEMNNPLTVIRGRSQLLATRLGDPKDRATAEAIASAAEDLSGLISGLHLVASPPTPKLASVDPSLVARAGADAGKAAARGAAGASRVVLDSSGASGQVVTDSELATRAIAALVANAIEAAPGKIVRVAVQTGPSEGRWVVSVTDEGPGLSDRALKHAFDPFFSEKPAGRQRGLGLPAARTLAQCLNGRVTLSNAMGHGAVARIEFLPPAASARAA